MLHRGPLATAGVLRARSDRTHARGRVWGIIDSGHCAVNGWIRR